MHKRLIFAGVVLCVAALSAAAADLKIGFVDYQQIFARYEGTKEAQDKYDKEVAKWEQEATKRQKEIRDLKEKIEKQSLLLSAERKKELEDSLSQKLSRYEQFLQSKFGQKGEALSKNEELVKPIVEKIQQIIDRISKEENYDFIFDKRGGGVVFGKPAYDLTERVLVLLNKAK